MSLRWICTTALCAVLLAACGSSTPPATPPLKLNVTSPADGGQTFDPEVQVRGSVGPGASSVLVAGKRVAVHRGSFVTWVPVAAGRNVIDILAGAPRAAAAMTVVRVYRQLPVAVPDVGGQDPDTASQQLTEARLSPQLQRSDGDGGFFGSLLPEQVCSIDPPAGSLVRPGSQVILHIARFC